VASHPEPEHLDDDSGEEAGPGPAPWWKRGTWADRLCLGGIALNSVIGLITMFFIAYLLARPLRYLALRGSAAALISAGALASVGRLNLVAAILCAFIGVMGFDVFYWWAGQRYEHRLATDLPKLFSIPEKRIGQAESIMGRHGFWILVVRYFQPIPNALLYVFAGAGGMGLRRFLVADALGAALWIGVLGAAGWLAGARAVGVVDAITDNALKVTLGLVVVLVVWQQVKRKRAPSRQ
jgi:membrane protein DedA with SNARE-associated domain